MPIPNALLDADPASPMVILENRWYNALVSGLAVSPAMFQISQPAAPLAPSDLALWAYQNVLPPASLTFRRPPPSATTFFREYAAVASQIQFPASTFRKDIGEQVYAEWTAELATILPPPTLHELPALFESWALLNAPSVAGVGVADLTEMALIDDAQHALDPYLDPSPRPADFLGTYERLQQTLAVALEAQVSLDSNTTSSDVTATWTGGVDTGVGGLWTGDDGSPRLSQKFATSRVVVDTTFAGATVWPSTPGAWYDSALLHLAFSSPATPPWLPKAHPNWTEAFGPEGSLRYLIPSFSVVDGIQATITSSAAYTRTEQKTIRDQAAAGLWPFYAPNSTAVSNTMSFGAVSGMTIKTTSQRGNPLVLGANVLGVAQYLGAR